MKEQRSDEYSVDDLLIAGYMVHWYKDKILL